MAEKDLQPSLYQLACSGTFGLERETLRVDAEGYLAQTPHPFPGHSHIDRDFCECQVEIISPVCQSVDEVYKAITALDEETYGKLRQMDPPEYLWPFSNPPYILGEDSIPIAQYEGDLAHKTDYRNYLAEKYGKRLMLFCGIHFNYGYPEAFVSAMQEQLGLSSLRETKDHLYLQLSQKLELTSWLLVFLTAASPIFDESFFEEGLQGMSSFTGEASMRSGEDGYWNDFVPIIDYSTMPHYTASIQQYVDQGLLRSPSEWYTPVRIKPRGENSLETLLEKGADHIELRMLDVNPLYKAGISKTDLEFIHYYLLYLTFQKTEPFGEAEQIAAVHDHKAAALYDVSNVTVQLHGRELPLETAALQFLNEMEQFFSQLGETGAMPILEAMKQRCTDPTKRHAHQVYDLFHVQYVEKGLTLAKEYSVYGAPDLSQSATIRKAITSV